MPETRWPRGPSRRSDVAPFLAMDVLQDANALAAQGRDVLHLELGQPGLGAPEPVLEAVRRAMKAGPLGYTEALGLPALRARIARHYGEAHGLDIAPERVAVTTGSSAALILACLAGFDSGARVALGQPWYPAYPNILKALNLTPVAVPLDVSGGYRLTARVLRGVDGFDGVLYSSPANPTGTILYTDELSSLGALCRERGAHLIADEIYHGIHYERPAPTALTHMPEAIVINGFSKFYCMTGWRLGWMVVPEQLMRTVERLAQNLMVAPPAPSQYGALAAFEPDSRAVLADRVAAYGRNRARMLDTLRAAGFGALSPAEGAFYIYAELPQWAEDSVQFCRNLLGEAGIAATPGQDFDPVRGGRAIRVCFAGSETDMAAACARLHAWSGGHGNTLKRSG